MGSKALPCSGSVPWCVWAKALRRAEFRVRAVRAIPNVEAADRNHQF